MKHPKTQKAKSMAILAGYLGVNLAGLKGPGSVVRSTGSIWDGKPLVKEGGAFPVTTIWPLCPEIPAPPFFARPCPLKPRHGFVDSRLIHRVEDFARLVAETMALDSSAEFILMPKFTGKWSAIATPSMAVIGQGSDGATSGKKGIVLAAPTSPKAWAQSFLNSTSDGVTLTYDRERECIFVEVVEHQGDPRMVQLRAGPLGATVGNYIPKKVEVAYVWSALNHYPPSLLEWETMVAGWKDIPGYVVYWPGGSLASHYAVHCVQAGIPFIVEGPMPKVGQVLEPAENGPKPPSAIARQRMADMLKEIVAAPKWAPPFSHHHMVIMGAATAHSHSFWGNSALEIKLRAWAFASLIRYVATGCIGEARHFYSSGPGRPTPMELGIGTENGSILAEDQRSAAIDWIGVGLAHDKEWKNPNPGVNDITADWHVWQSAGGEVVGHHIIMPRDTVYTKLHDWPMDKLMAVNALAYEDLKPPGWYSGMGGSKWADSSQLATKAWGLLQVFMDKPTAKNWQSLASAVNMLTNAAHNNGKVLGKWVAGDTLDALSRAPSLGLAGLGEQIIKLAGLWEEWTGEPWEAGKWEEVDPDDVAEAPVEEPPQEEPQPEEDWIGQPAQILEVGSWPKKVEWYFTEQTMEGEVK